MAAVIDLHTGHRLDESAASARTASSVQPDLRVLQGGRSPEALRRRRVYLRRRVIALAVCAIAVVALYQGFSSMVALASPGPAAASSESYVVSAGDSYWSIARTIAPDLDPRNVVDDLTSLNGSGPIHAGEHLRLPVLAD